MTPEQILEILNHELYTGPGSHPYSESVCGTEDAAKRIAEEIQKQNAEYIEALREAKEQNEELKNAFMDIWECFGEPGIPNIDYIENAVNKVVEKYMP